MSRPEFIAIVGQTASGKSGLAMRIAREIECEIICADSRTVYRGLDIGTAKPSIQDQQEVPHHLVDVADWGEPYNVVDFQKAAKAAIEDIRSRGKMPLLVGLSGLYVDSILYDYDFGPLVSTDERKILLAKSVEELQEQVLAAGLELPENSKNKRYLIRMLERGQPPDNRKQMREDVLVVGLKLEQEVLEARIRKRIDNMLKEGLLDEVQQAIADYPADSEALKGDAYRAFRPYFEDGVELSACVEECVKLDKRLAKQSYVWFKRNNNIHWFSSAQDAYEFIASQLSL